ncbi:MAG: hypothetical protein FJX72_17495, partial [Armatimonadetes bacterium]|nr:hypothetical protein [Armatimonadota bacterium]
SIRASADKGVKGARCILTVWDWHNQPVHSAPYPAPFDETVTFDVSGRGCYTLTLDLFDGDKCAARLVRSFAACPDNRERRALWKASGFAVGGCSFPGRQHWTNDYGPAHPPGLTEQASRDMDAELSARMGLQVVRIDPPFEWPSESAPLDFTRADASVAAFTSRGFTLNVQLDPAPDWAVLPAYKDRKDPLWRYPHREGPTRRIAREVAQRYGKHAAFFEIWNEPDNRDFWRGTVTEFVDYTRWCAEEIRKAAPGVTITNGGYTLIEPQDTGAIARQVRGLVDATAYHYHGTVEGLPAAFGSHRAIQAAAGVENPMFYNTEMGYAAWRLDVERNMAASAVHKLLFSWAHGHRAALIYCTRDIGGPRMKLPEADWGCVDYTFCPRRVYGAVSAFVDRLAGLTTDAVLCEKPQLFAYSFRGDDRRVVALFAPDEAGRKVTVVSDAKSAEVVDVMGNAAPAPAAGRVEAKAWLYPTYVVLHGATRVAVEGMP